MGSRQEEWLWYSRVGVPGSHELNGVGAGSRELIEGVVSARAGHKSLLVYTHNVLVLSFGRDICDRHLWQQKVGVKSRVVKTRLRPGSKQCQHAMPND